MSSASDSPSPTAIMALLSSHPEGAEIITYKGNCHCRKFSYEFQHPALDVKKPLKCNCTFCTRTGTLNIFGPDKLFRLDENSAGWDEFGKFKSKLRPTTHHFCKECGCYLFWKGPGTMGVNVRMFGDVEVDKLSVIPVDGRSSDQNGAKKLKGQLEAN